MGEARCPRDRPAAAPSSARDFLDDRAALVAVLSAARQLRAQGRRPAADVHLVMTTGEELGGVGASYASASLPGSVTLAVDVGPTEAEYGTTVDGGPVIAHADAAGVYDEAIADRLLAIGADLGSSPQPAALRSFESDASQSKSKGQAPRSGLIGLPTLSTHGDEVVHRGAIDGCARLLAEYLVHSAR
ncbi:M20/M25/M40 family metallo-hydrolase [Quadrisphaera sp. DSM 44207]|uniref:M20/M25/M40 family metallo-hydrolase n=1 Tax=Quadrisphaera sp. DSM 44207 TaxID=1881057 RepID=UPI000B8694FE|nr:M20/M25/M40 family metallo-hydrolase [Quadrisphaera sp. DSM 44207]